MPIYPRKEQIEAVLASKITGPICMLNLLKFKERAAYEDGRETSLSGREAYQLYAEKMAPYVEAKGGVLKHTSAAHLLVIGDGELEWDAVGIMQYPSTKDFAMIAGAPEVAEFAVHRTAGLDHQLLVACAEGAL